MHAGLQEQDAENRNQGMEDDEVLLATSDDDESLPERISSPSKALPSVEEGSRAFQTEESSSHEGRETSG